MLLLGHIGITWAVVVLPGHAIRAIRSMTAHPDSKSGNSHYSLEKPSRNNYGTLQRITSLGSTVNIRLLLIGSLLPDIIDKPIGQFFFREYFSNGRIVGHTLLFLVLITIIGLFLYKSRNSTWLLVLSFGTFVHLILDAMWLTPQTLFWPLYGFTFEKIDLGSWIPDIFRALTSNPLVYLPELMGFVLIVWLMWRQQQKRKSPIY